MMRAAILSPRMKVLSREEPLMRLPQARLLVLVLALAGCSRSPSDSSGPAKPTEPPWFEDVTDRLGLKFTHDCGPITPAYFMPQIAGSGCAFLDFDGDGRLDIYLIHNGGPKGAKNRLFHQ